jgi:hypothetical protein
MFRNVYLPTSNKSVTAILPTEYSAGSNSRGFRLIRQPRNLLNSLQYPAHSFADLGIARTNRRRNVNVARRINGDEGPVCSSENDFYRVAVIVGHMQQNRRTVDNFQGRTHSKTPLRWFDLPLTGSSADGLHSVSWKIDKIDELSDFVRPPNERIFAFFARIRRDNQTQ